MSAVATAPAEHHETLIDHPGEAVDVNEVMRPTAPIASGMREQFHLDDFFARPVSLARTTWPVGVAPDLIIRPWHLWASVSSVRSKLTNYRFFRGKLHVKIAITGTPYHYGKVLVSYQPYDVLNQTLIAYHAITTVSDGAMPAQPTDNSLKCYLSQAHEPVVMDVNDNQPVEMVLDFVSPKQAWIIGNEESTVIVNSTIFPDFFVAGALRLKGINRIHSASGGTASAVTVAIYGYMTDVELSLPTSTDMNIEAQSRVVRDEYRGVSSGLSALSNAAGALAMVPVIGSFAQTASSAAKAASSIAHFFGFSRPADLGEGTVVRNMVYENGAITQGKLNVFKLSVDPKQEVTIDPFNGGAVTDKDELAIAAIASRWSYLGSSTWQSNAVEGVTLLTQLAVTSMQHAVDNTNHNHSVEQPAAVEFAGVLHGRDG